MATRLYGIVWRWHFLAGLIACPILFVVALTGAAYVFQPELERTMSPRLHHVAAGATPRPVDELLGHLPADCAPGTIMVAPERDRSLTVWCAGGPERRVFLDPYTGEHLGTEDWHASLFGIVFELHWELMLGERGRLAIEWATSWAVLLMLSGAYLWWPRGRGAAWVPRRDVAGRQRLRDLHAICGAYALPVLLAIAASGLLWTKLAGGERWQKISADEMDVLWEKPPVSTVRPGVPPIGYDAAIAAAGARRTGDPRLVTISRTGDDPTAPYNVYLSAPDYGAPTIQAVVIIDAYAGTELRRLGWDDHSTLGKIGAAGYPVHVGTLLGLPGRIAALVAALVLCGLCVTGPWMWWKRRPAGKLGVPPRARRFAWPMLALLLGLGWLLPTVGYTLIAAAIFEGARLLIRRLLIFRGA